MGAPFDSSSCGNARQVGSHPHTLSRQTRLQKTPPDDQGGVLRRSFTILMQGDAYDRLHDLERKKRDLENDRRAVLRLRLMR